MFNIRKYLSTIFINLVIKDKSCSIEAYSVKNEKIIKIHQRTFIEEDKNKLLKYIKTLIDNHYFTYVSLLFTSIGQGMVPTINKTDLQKFGVDSSAVSLKIFDNSFLYAAKTELINADIVFDELQVDLIYSPFSILFKLIQDKKSDGFVFDGISLFVLKYGEFITLMIYDGKKFKFGSYFELKINKDNEEDHQTLELEEEIELDSNNDTLEELDFDEFDNVKVDDNFDLGADLNSDLNENLQSFSLDMQIFEYINSAIKEFYNNNIYDSDFINNIIIFEHEKSSKAMHSYIESELLIKPIVYTIDIFKEMLKLSSNDLGAKIDI
ncbi:MULTISPECIES: hypothetical protein [unclassified Campylobacter]|uniref:hypothetical protein n=1 Tax=unclassified Campylobacter TaxID=2593542 RepID=UPI001E160CBD|nr:hypothetical protein [Campylobacter sp. RM12651]MBZ7984257.1 hypothetical protein [Campylobacter sp. RM12647]